MSQEADQGKALTRTEFDAAMGRMGNDFEKLEASLAEVRTEIRSDIAALKHENAKTMELLRERTHDLANTLQHTMTTVAVHTEKLNHQERNIAESERRLAILERPVQMSPIVAPDARFLFQTSSGAGVLGSVLTLLAMLLLRKAGLF